MYRTRSVRSLLSSIVPLSNIVPQKLEKNIDLEGKNKALSDIVRTLQKLKEIQAAVCNRADTVDDFHAKQRAISNLHSTVGKFNKKMW